MSALTIHPSDRGAAKRVLVCGGRDFHDKTLVWRTLDEVAGVSEAEPLGWGVTIIHGACPTGADMWADGWAVAN